MIYEFKLNPTVCLAISSDKTLVKPFITLLNLKYGSTYSRNTHKKHLQDLYSLHLLDENLMPIDNFQDVLQNKLQCFDHNLLMTFTMNGFYDSMITINQDYLFSSEQLYSFCMYLMREKKKCMFMNDYFRKYKYDFRRISQFDRYDRKFTSGFIKEIAEFRSDLFNLEIRKQFGVKVDWLINQLKRKGFLSNQPNYIKLNRGCYTDEDQKTKSTKIINGFLVEQVANKVDYSCGFAFEGSEISRWGDKLFSEYEKHETFYFETEKYPTHEKFIKEYIGLEKFRYKKITSKKKRTEIIKDKSTNEVLVDVYYEQTTQKGVVDEKEVISNIKYTTHIHSSVVYLYENRDNIVREVYEDGVYLYSTDLTIAKIKQYQFFKQKQLKCQDQKIRLLY